MPREHIHHRHNYNDSGHAHELTFSCYNGYKFLSAERTCLWLAESINEARSKWNFDLCAYVFMPEHAHLIIHPQERNYDIAQIRKAMKSPVVTKAIGYLEKKNPEWLPKIIRRRGKKTERLFWQSGGGNDRNITEPSTLMKMMDYIHMNPVRRGLVERAEEWNWSSASWFLGKTDVPLVPD